jgi:hypothetical protein
VQGQSTGRPLCFGRVSPGLGSSGGDHLAGSLGGLAVRGAQIAHEGFNKILVFAAAVRWEEC